MGRLGRPWGLVVFFLSLALSMSSVDAFVPALPMQTARPLSFLSDTRAATATATSTPSFFHQHMPYVNAIASLHEKPIDLQWMDFCDHMGHTDAPVVFLHGLLGSKRNFATLATALCKRLKKQRRILGVDLRNHGDSEHASDMSYSAMAEDVVEFLDQRNINKAILVGHSMGGKVAQAVSILHPDRVAGLVSVDIAPVRYTSTSDPQWKVIEDIVQAMHSVGRVASKAQLDKLLRVSIPDPNVRAFVLTNYDAKTKEWKIPVQTIRSHMDSLAGFDMPEDSQSYDGDVLIINGGQSRFVRHAHLNQISEFFPNHAIMTVRSAGHWVHAEAPDNTAALLQQYLDR
eukprot:Nitzschia sp. Nitz4//scaffold52_size167869//88143//89174//NITZ4_002280-RA/size167869-processed-gene-0.131-mRNA-1//-1//CDS//3329554047//6254//frame0